MEKLDLSKTFPAYYKAVSNPELVELPQSQHLSISGVGAPEGELFGRSIAAINKVAYTVKFRYKAHGRDFKVPKMSAQWWVESGKIFEQTPRHEWCWNVFFQMPAYVQGNIVDDCIEQVITKHKACLAAEVHLVDHESHKAVQALHLGSYENEKETIERVFGYMGVHGLSCKGYHHEIYLSDPRKTAEERLKTIIRYAVE